MDHVRAHRRIAWLAWTGLAGAALFALQTTALASPAIVEHVPVPGGIAALARALDIDVPDRARCLSEIARLAYAHTDYDRSDPQSPYRRLIAHLSATASVSTAAAPRITDEVPVPLTTSIWNRTVFRRPVTSQTLFAAILLDANAALLAHGLAALDDETLQFFADHPALVTTLYRRHATVFASFAAHLRIRNNRIVPPGGDPAVPLWEAVLNERVTNPIAFVTALYATAEGRLAYLYDIIGHLDDPNAAFVLGSWLPDKTTRIERFQTLSKAAASVIREWNATKVPFSRPAFDLLMLITRVQVERSGAPRFPASERLWAVALAGGRDHGSGDRTSSAHDQPIDAAWLTAVVLSGNGQMRRDRLDQFAFGQRVFAAAQDADPSDVAAAIRSFPDVPTLMLTLERIGVRRPAAYAALARHAQRLTRLDAVHAYRALAQFQGAVAVVARLVRVQTIDRATAEQLLDSLASVPFDEHRGYMGAIVLWLERRLRPAIATAAVLTFDEALVQALAGPAGRQPIVPLSWEGQPYVFDLNAGETRRLRRFREGRIVSSLDATIRMHDAVTKHAANTADSRAMVETLGELRSVLSKLPNTTKTLQQLNGPASRQEQPPSILLEAVDASIADALLSFSYAIDWSDAPSPVEIDRELPRRHDFGLAAPSIGGRTRIAWAVPRLVFQPGEPWRVQGAALGLDIALASLALRRIDSAAPFREPSMLGMDRHSFVVSLGLLNVFALRDGDADAIAEAVGRGLRRVEALGAGSTEVSAVIDEIAMDGWRARALRWSLVHRPHDVTALFSTTELLHLGAGRHLDVHVWGMSGLAALGCLCTHAPPPRLQTAFGGRYQVGLLPATVPDLNLRVTIALRELELPAALTKDVLQMALADLLNDVRLAHADDWLALVRRARAVSRERIEDYVAAVTASEKGPLSSLPSGRRLP